MIKQVLLVVALFFSQALAFAPARNAHPKKSALSLAVVPPPSPVMDVAVTTAAQQQYFRMNGPMSQGINNYLSKASLDSSSVTVSLKERKIPTKEEIAAKKRNFNLIFWGGGFVAPFAATVFYFGFDFWKK